MIDASMVSGIRSKKKKKKKKVKYLPPTAPKTDDKKK